MFSQTSIKHGKVENTAGIKQPNLLSLSTILISSVPDTQHMVLFNYVNPPPPPGTSKRYESFNMEDVLSCLYFLFNDCSLECL